MPTDKSTEVERLTAELKEERRRRVKLEREVERLRAALQNIIVGNGGECGCAETASAALDGRKA